MELVLLLIQNGSRVNAINKFSKTPLDLAVEDGWSMNIHTNWIFKNVYKSNSLYPDISFQHFVQIAVMWLKY